MYLEEFAVLAQQEFLFVAFPVVGAWPGGLIARIFKTTLRFAHSPILGGSLQALAGNSGQDLYRLPLQGTSSMICRENDVRSVIEFGCADGNQLRLCRISARHWIDISRAAVEMCADFTVMTRPRNSCASDVRHHRLRARPVAGRHLSSCFRMSLRTAT